MSADNGVYIVQTKGPEFRVAYQQNINAVYGNFSDETYRWDPNEKELVDYFRDAPVYSDLQEALDFAETISYTYEYLEDGICLITDFKEYDFQEMKEHHGKEAKSGSR